MKIVTENPGFYVLFIKRFLCLITFLLCIILCKVSVSAEDKSDYRNIFVLGINKPLSNADVNTLSPVFAYYYINKDLQNDLYLFFTVKTTSAYLIFGEKNEKYFTGIKPFFNYLVYGAYHSYTNGVNDDRRCLNSSNAGVEIFYEYMPVKYFKAGVSYYPGYYWYWRKKRSDFLFTRQDDTEIVLPGNHMEHTGVFDITISNVEKKDMDRIKNGFILQGISKYSYRHGYGTFYDTNEAEDSSISRTLKNYFNAGCYYNFENNVNLMLDLSAACHRNTDRNNSDQIGSYISDNGVMPGYYWGEFYHNRYIITRIQTGLPLFFYAARIQPGFNILYMPEKNGVRGADNYPRTIYRSVSVELSLKAGGVLPLYFDYAYGIDARRVNSSDGTEKKGNHEFMFYAVAAF